MKKALFALLLICFTQATVARGQTCLPTGVCLDPAGRSFAAGNMPLAMVLSPEGDRLVLSLNGWRQQGIQVVDRHTGTIVQMITQPSAFLGLAFSHDGRTLYASGGNEDVVYRYAWRDKQATLIDSIILAPKEPKKDVRAAGRFARPTNHAPSRGSHVWWACWKADAKGVHG